MPLALQVMMGIFNRAFSMHGLPSFPYAKVEIKDGTRNDFLSYIREMNIPSYNKLERIQMEAGFFIG